METIGNRKENAKPLPVPVHKNGKDWNSLWLLLSCHDESSHITEKKIPKSFYKQEDFVKIDQMCETLTLLKLILSNYLKVCFDNYFIILLAVSVLPSC